MRNESYGLANLEMGFGWSEGWIVEIGAYRDHSRPWLFVLMKYGILPGFWWATSKFPLTVLSS
jgi:hypothetical protein